jgi:spermidine/putrescine transport system ATP-binding protein
MSFLQIRNLSVAYEDNNQQIEIIKNLNLDLDQGSICTILGESGSGKTTLLKSIAGLTPKLSGEIILNDISISNLPVYEREIGYLPQEPTLFQHLSVYENIAFGLRIKKKPEKTIQERVQSLAKIVGISEILTKSVDQISGGQAQRVSLCRALAPEPTLMLFDEPFSSLDSNLRYKLALEFKRIQKNLSITTIHVTHDQYEARLIADYIGIITNNKLAQFDSKKDIKPLNWKIAQILGYPNIISPEFYSFFDFPKNYQIKYKNGGFLNPEKLVVTQKGFSKLTGIVIEKNPLLEKFYSHNSNINDDLHKVWIYVEKNSLERNLYLLVSIKEPLLTKEVPLNNLAEAFIPF